MLYLCSKYDGDLPFEHAMKLYERSYTKNALSKQSLLSVADTNCGQDTRLRLQRNSPYHQYIERFYGVCYQSQAALCAHHADAYATGGYETEQGWTAALAVRLGLERFAPVAKRIVNCRLGGNDKSNNDGTDPVLCPVRLIQVAHTTHNSVYRSQQWGQHIHDFLADVSAQK